MARAVRRLTENAPGDLFVDDSCIDCGICRWLAPEVFAARGGTSYVRRQPEGALDARRAAMALVACPTSSIGGAPAADVAAASRAFPEPIDDDVYFCGYASADSYGASSWLVRRAAGNVLVDSPRAARPLLDRLGALGGVATMFLTHRDDVADHAVFHARFGCERVMHRADALPGIDHVLDGAEPIRLADDLLAVPVPGHTRGSVALLYRERFLFTGDHLWYDRDARALEASRSVCWYSWREQTRSMERLLDLSFEWVLPGHGDPWHAPSAPAMRAALDALLARMRRA